MIDMKRICFILAFLISQTIVSAQFHATLSKKEKTFLITWDKFKGNQELLVGYKIYLSEGYIPQVFPKTQIDSLGKTVLGWESLERQTYNSLGLDIRVVNQWGDKKVITPGFSYTIGVERIIKNSITMKEGVERTICYILPFEFLPLNQYANKERKKIAPSKYYILPDPIKSFIHGSGDTVYFNFKNKISQVQAILEEDEFYILKLNDQLVKFHKPPHRAEAFGNPKIVMQSLGLIIGCFIVMLLLFLFYIIVKALIALNYISNNKDNVNFFLAEIIEKEVFSVLIIYVMVSFTSDSIISKFFNMLLKKIILIDINLFQDRFIIITKIAGIYDENSLFQYNKIKLEILDSL
jgi:hypothetical protein